MKKINVIFFLLWFLPGIEDAKVPAPSNNYHLVGFAEDLSSVAGIVSGIAVAQQIQEATLKEDELVGELFLGPDRKMGSLADVDASGLAMDLEEIGKVVGRECGSGGCGKFDEKAVKDGIDVLVAIDGALTGQQKDLLKHKQAFAELTELQDLLKALVTSESEISTIYAALNATNVMNHDGLANFFIRNTERLKKVVASESEFEKLKSSVSLLKTTRRAKFIEKIDILLGLESIHKNLPAGKDQVEKMKNELATFAQRSTELAVAISSGRVGRIEQTMDKLTPIVSWSSKHPLLRLIFDFDMSVRRFIDKFFSGANADGKSEARLKPVLEPIRRLTTDLKPLQASWMKKPDRILESIEKVRSNLTVALSELDALSSLSSLHQCIKDVALESRFSVLQTVKDDLNAIEDDRVDSIISLQNPYENLTEFIQFVKTGFEKGIDFDEIMSQMRKITNVAEVLEELQAFEGQSKVKNLATGDIEKFFESKTLKTVFSDLKMDSLIGALDCVKKENLLSKDVRPADLTSLRNLNSDNLEMQTLISTSRHVNRAMEEWTSMSSKKAPQGKTRRAAETQNGMLNDASRLAKTFLDAVKTAMDLATTFKAKERLIDFFKSERVIDEEISALSDQQRKQTLAKVWNEDTKKALRQYQPEMERLDGYFSTRPKTLEELNGLLKSLHSLAVSPFDSFAFSKAMSFVKDSVTRSRLLVFGQVDLRFDNANARLEDASRAFVPLETYFNGLLDVRPERTIVNSTIASAPAEESFFFIFEKHWPIIAGVSAVVVILSVAVFIICKFCCKRKDYKVPPPPPPKLQPLFKKHQVINERVRKDGVERERNGVMRRVQDRALEDLQNRNKKKTKKQVETKQVGDGVVVDPKYATKETLDALSKRVPDAKKADYAKVEKLAEEQERLHDPEQYGGLDKIPTSDPVLLPHYSREFLEEPYTRKLPKHQPSQKKITVNVFERIIVFRKQEDIGKDAAAETAVDDTGDHTASSVTSKTARGITDSKADATQKTMTKTTQEVPESTPLLAAEKASTTRKVAGDDSTDSESDDEECPPQYYKISEVEREGGVVQRHGQPRNPEADYVEVKEYKDCCSKFRDRLQDYEQFDDSEEARADRERIKQLAEKWEREAAAKRAAAAQPQKDDEAVGAGQPLGKEGRRVAVGADRPRENSEPSDWRETLPEVHNPSEALRQKYFKNSFMSPDGKMDFIAALGNMLSPEFVSTEGFFLPEYRPYGDIYPMHLKEVRTVLTRSTQLFKKDNDVLQLNCLPIVLGDIQGAP